MSFCPAESRRRGGKLALVTGLAVAVGTAIFLVGNTVSKPSGSLVSVGRDVAFGTYQAGDFDVTLKAWKGEVGLPRLHGLFAFKPQHLLSV